jgi:tetratricopeptide (TPR) repeat protein
MDRREFPKLPEGLRSWSDAKQVFELNEIVLKACASEPRARYASVEPMLVELQMLLGGKSVKRRRTAQWWWAAAWRAGIGFAALGAIAAIVAVPMRGHPLPESYSDGPDSTNNVANVLCRKAIHVIRDDIYDEFSEAYSNLLKAARLDPRFARPYIGMLELRLRETFPGVPPAKTSEMKEIANKLNELLSNSAPAYCAQSVIQFYDWHFLQAEQCAQKAIKVNPNYELAHTFYAFMLTQWGTNRLDEARRELALSDSLLPGKATIPRCLGHIAYVERNFTNAISLYARALALEPHHAPAILYTGRAYQALGDYTNAVTCFRQFRELFTTNRLAVAGRYDSLLQALREGGERGYWQWYWRQTEKLTNSDFYFKAVVRIHLGDTNSALEWLNLSYTKREHFGDFQTPLTRLLFDEHWDGLHDDPRFKALLDKVGFTKVMGPPKK